MKIKQFRMVTYGDPNDPIDPERLDEAIRDARAGRRFPEFGDRPKDE